MGNVEKKTKEVLVSIEGFILAIGVFLSISGTSAAVKYSDAYIPYYLYMVAGLACIFILSALRKKQFTVYLGFVMICAYVLFAGLGGYVTCVTAAYRFENLERYKDARITLSIDDEVYEWNGEAFYEGDQLTRVSLEGKKVYMEINEKEQEDLSIFVKQENYDILYYEISRSATGEYLVMKKVKK